VDVQQGIHCITIATLLLLAWPTAARGDEIASESPPPSHIYNGEQAGTCEFPTAVSLGSCTATLVHPELIIYAAHCGSNYGSVFFGNDTDGQGFSVGTAGCEVNPNWAGIGYGVDVAYCRLAEPVTEVPFTPPLMGCETEVLQPGREVWIVGFGETEQGVYGVKHKALTTFNYTDGNDDANIGGNGTTVCFGDSGGPTFVQLREEDGFDGSWRAFGIASYVYTPCGTDGFSAMMHNGVQWVESASGVDVTPCHDADGTWNPSAACTGFPAEIDAGAGDWGSGCEPGPLVGSGATCGAPYGGGDGEAPTVAITSPADGQQVAIAPGESDAQVRVVVDAQDNVGIAEVTLVVDGVEAGSDASEPYEFDVMLGSGAHELEALAVDLDDNAGHSSTITIEVSGDGDPSGDGGSDPSDDDGGSDPSGDGGGSDPGDDDDDDDDDDGSAGDDGEGAAGPQALPPGFGLGAEAAGCGCGSTHGTSWWIAIVMLAVRRRTRRVAEFWKFKAQGSRSRGR